MSAAQQMAWIRRRRHRILADSDTTAPTVSNVTSAKTNGTYTTAEVIDITVQFTEAVTVTGSPRLLLETGTADRYATYQSGSTTDTLTFRYTVQAGDSSSDLDYKATDSLELNSGTIQDAAGNNATLTLVAPGQAGSLGANKAIVIDAVAPVVTGVSSNTSNGTITAASTTVDIRVTFSKAVTVAGGTPQLTISIAGTTRAINYSSGSGSTVLVFNYSTVLYDYSTDLDYASTTALALNGATIRDATGNNATLTLATPGQSGSLGNAKAIVIDINAIDQHTYDHSWDGKDLSGSSWIDGPGSWDLTAAGSNASVDQATTGLIGIGGIGLSRVTEAVKPAGSAGGTNGYAISTQLWANPIFHLRILVKPNVAISSSQFLFRHIINASNLIEIRGAGAAAYDFTIRAAAGVYTASVTSLAGNGNWHLIDWSHHHTAGAGSNSRSIISVNGVDKSPADAAFSVNYPSGSNGNIGVMSANLGTSTSEATFVFVGVRFGVNHTLVAHQADWDAMT